MQVVILGAVSMVDTLFPLEAYDADNSFQTRPRGTARLEYKISEREAVGLLLERMSCFIPS